MRSKLSIFLIVSILTIFACHQPENPAGTAASRRMRLIAALKELRGRILSGDKAQIAGLFTFPLPDSVFNVYIDDSIFQQEYTKHGNALTRQMFYTYFKKIGVGPGDFPALFSFLSPDSLIKKDTIEYDDIVDTLPYYSNYSIVIDNDSLVSIRFTTGSNSSYVPTKKAGDTVRGLKNTLDTAGFAQDTADGKTGTIGAIDDEEDPSEYEHAIGWEFVFDGKKLRFMREYQAD